MVNPLRKARVARRMSQADLAKATGLTQALLSNLERSERSLEHPERFGPTAEHAAVLAKFFVGELTIMQILYPADYMEKPTTVAA